MSLHLDFEPHSWYMGFAIKKNLTPSTENEHGGQRWRAFTANGNTYQVDEVSGTTLKEIRQAIIEYHLRQQNGYAERILERRAS